MSRAASPPKMSWRCLPRLSNPTAPPPPPPSEHIRSDNGPEFIARIFRDGLANRGIRTLYIDPGSPWQNGYVQSFNSRFRDECLNGEQLYTLSEARVVISDWIGIYNEERPHGGVRYLTPNEAAARPRASGPWA
jgi:putative transposase